MSGRTQRVMVPPIVSRRAAATAAAAAADARKNLIFKLLQQQTPVSIWLYEQTNARMVGTIKGFDEFMNLVVDNAVEVSQDESAARRELGRILLKGDNIAAISSAAETPA